MKLKKRDCTITANERLRQKFWVASGRIFNYDKHVLYYIHVHSNKNVLRIFKCLKHILVIHIFTYPCQFTKVINIVIHF